VVGINKIITSFSPSHPYVLVTMWLNILSPITTLYTALLMSVVYLYCNCHTCTWKGNISHSLPLHATKMKLFNVWKYFKGNIQSFSSLGTQENVLIKGMDFLIINHLYVYMNHHQSWKALKASSVHSTSIIKNTVKLV